jgi:hypothetical protein
MTGRMRAFLGALTFAVALLSLNFGAYAASRCEAYPLQTWRNSAYDREVGSNTYLLFAVASWEAYGFDPDKDNDITFRVREYGKPDIWQAQRSIEDPTGMHADVYHHKNGEYLDVLIAFRGTRGWNLRDWYSNLSQVTPWRPVSNAYDSARQIIPAVIRQAEIDAGQRTIRYVSTGHSLGGGIAQYVARTFPCFSAVTFDSSCVVGADDPKSFPAPKVVNLYETGDELTRFCKLAAGVAESDDYRQFNVKVVSDGLHHRMLGFVVGMSRLVTHCQQEVLAKQRAHCGVSMEDRRAHDLYCSSYGYVGPDRICEKQYWTKPTRRSAVEQRAGGRSFG